MDYLLCLWFSDFLLGTWNFKPEGPPSTIIRTPFTGMSQLCMAQKFNELLYFTNQYRFYFLTTQAMKYTVIFSGFP